MCKGPAATVDEGLLPSGVSLNVRSLLVSLHFQVNTSAIIQEDCSWAMHEPERVSHNDLVLPNKLSG
jgi:hypothetical protein